MELRRTPHFPGIELELKNTVTQRINRACWLACENYHGSIEYGTDFIEIDLAGS
jgi:hypothetical protein